MFRMTGREHTIKGNARCTVGGAGGGNPPLQQGRADMESAPAVDSKRYTIDWRADVGIGPYGGWSRQFTVDGE